MHRQWEWNLFCKKRIKIYYSVILNNHKNYILGGCTFTVENGQSDGPITFANDVNVIQSRVT